MPYIPPPFQRCIDTIEPTATNLWLEIITDIRLGEVILWPMQGKSWLEVSNEYNKKLHDINETKMEWCEHMSEVRKRVAEFINEIYLTNIWKNIIICSHAGTIINMMAILEKDILNSKDFLPDNKYYDERTFRIIEINDLTIKKISIHLILKNSQFLGIFYA